MNMDVAFISCLFGNSENDFVWRRIERDMDFEADIIAAEENFWINHVLAGVEPPYTESGDLVLQSIRNFYGNANEKAAAVVLPPKMVDAILEYESLKAEKSIANKAVIALEGKIAKVQAVVVEALGTSCSAMCTRGDVAFDITYNPVFKDIVDKEGLKASHPEVYAQYVTKIEKYRLLNIKRADMKKGVA